jgi:energy-coupling factor transporter ATP-binding protein EcfA2
MELMSRGYTELWDWFARRGSPPRGKDVVLQCTTCRVAATATASRDRQSTPLRREDEMPSLTAHHIKEISVRRLFGRYTYNVPRTAASFADLNILYGENGLGKTTMLNLVYHLLSPAANRNHKGAIADVPFERLEVVLQDGTRLTAEKDAQLLTGPTAFTITTSQGKETVWKYLPNVRPQFRAADLPANINVELIPSEMRDEVLRTLAERHYFEALEKLQVLPVMLTADRILLADSLEGERRRRPTPQAPERTLAEAVIDQRRQAVAQALLRASEWLRAKFYERTQRISSVSYENVVNRIATTPYKTREGLSKKQELEIRASLASKINWINERSVKITRFGVGGSMVSQRLLSAIDGSTGNKLHLIDNVLSPHLDELVERLTELWPVYELADGFVSIMNRFFRDKEITYNLLDGLKITSTGEPKASELARPTELEPQHLSSGEQQLVLIFCHVLTSRDRPIIFIIDEPEISLNILWQRQLVSSLEELAGDSFCQFLFASHSMEILAKHRNRVLELEEV